MLLSRFLSPSCSYLGMSHPLIHCELLEWTFKYSRLRVSFTEFFPFGWLMMMYEPFWRWNLRITVFSLSLYTTIATMIFLFAHFFVLKLTRWAEDGSGIGITFFHILRTLETISSLWLRSLKFVCFSEDLNDTAFWSLSPPSFVLNSMLILLFLIR